MLQRFYRENKSVINKTLMLAAFIFIVYFFLTTLYSYIAPFVIGYIFSLVLEPFVLLMNKAFKLKRTLAALLAIVLLLGGIALIGTKIVSRATREIKDLQTQFPSYTEIFTQKLDDVNAKLTEFIPVEMSEVFDSAVSSLLTTLTDFLSGAVKNTSINFVSSLPMALTNVILFLLSTFLFIKDKHMIALGLKGFLPEWVSSGAGTIKKGFLKAIVGYIKAQAIIMSVSTAICILGLTIVRIPYALVMGLVIGFVDALPIFGSGAVLWPWALFCLLTGDYTLAVGLMIIYGAVFLTRQLLEPKVLSEQIGIHPLLTLMSIYAGLRLFGFVGFFAGPMILVTAKIIFEMPDTGKVLVSAENPEANLAEPIDSE